MLYVQFLPFRLLFIGDQFPILDICPVVFILFIKFLITQHLFIQKLQFFESQASYKRLNKRYCRVATWPTNVKIRVFPRWDEGDRISASAARTKDPLARGGGVKARGRSTRKISLQDRSFLFFSFFLDEIRPRWRGQRRTPHRKRHSGLELEQDLDVIS